MMHWVLLAALALDLTSIRSEPNPQRRSELALANAGEAFDSAMTAYDAGDLKTAGAKLDEVRQSVDLSYQSLQDSGKDARHHPGPYKKAELKTRELVRRLEEMGHDVSVQDRGMVESVRDSVSKVHEALLQQIMSKK